MPMDVLDQPRTWYCFNNGNVYSENLNVNILSPEKQKKSKQNFKKCGISLLLAMESKFHESVDYFKSHILQIAIKLRSRFCNSYSLYAEI